MGLSTSFQQVFNTFGVRAVLTLSFLVTLCSLTLVSSEFSHDSGSRVNEKSDYWSNDQYEVCFQMGVPY